MAGGKGGNNQIQENLHFIGGLPKVRHSKLVPMESGGYKDQ
jgi:hypothetical protein